MKKDPIVEEVRKAREAIAKEAGFDHARIFEMLREESMGKGRKRTISK